jgi:lipid-A-disaccharide synthase
LNVPYISIVNLLAGRELFPEFLTSRDQSAAIARHVLGWLESPLQVARIRNELAALRSQVGQPGACAKAADIVLNLARQRVAA